MFVSLLWPSAAKASTTAVCDTYQVNGGDQAFLMNLNTPLEFGGTVYDGNIYVSPKGTVTFGQGDYTFWSYPATPSISIGSWDYHAFANDGSSQWDPGWGIGKDLYVRYGSTETSICVDWKVMVWGQSSGDPIYIRMLAQVDPVNHTWTPTYQVSSNAPAGARYGVRYTHNGQVFPLEIQTITEPPTPEPTIEPTPEPTPEEPTPSPTPTPQPSPEEPTPSPSPTPEPSPEPTPEPSPTPSPVEPVEPVVPPTNPVDPTPEPSLEPEPVVPPEIQPEEPEQAVTPIEEPEESVEPSPELTPSIIEPEEESITSAEELPVDISSEELLNIDLDQIEATDLSEAQVEALVEAALEVFETAEPGSEEYEQALDALFLAAEADDIVLDEALAAIPLLGDILSGATELVNFLGNAGADMSPEVREDSEKIVVAAVVAVQAALSAVSISGIATTVNLRSGA
jgi:hypothetical protein